MILDQISRFITRRQVSDSWVDIELVAINQFLPGGPFPEGRNLEWNYVELNGIEVQRLQNFQKKNTWIQEYLWV